MEALHSASRAKAGASAEVLQSAEQREFAEDARRQAVLGADPPAVADAAEGPRRRLHRARPAGSGDHGGPAADPFGRPSRPGGAHAAAVGQRGGRIRNLLRPAPAPAGPAARLPGDFRALVRQLDEGGRQILAQQLHDQVGAGPLCAARAGAEAAAAAGQRLAARAGRGAQIADRRPVGGDHLRRCRRAVAARAGEDRRAEGRVGSARGPSASARCSTLSRTPSSESYSTTKGA